MALFRYGFKRKYVGFHESFFANVYVYNLSWNFSASKLSWYTVVVWYWCAIIIIVNISYHCVTKFCIVILKTCQFKSCQLHSKSPNISPYSNYFMHVNIWTINNYVHIIVLSMCLLASETFWIYHAFFNWLRLWQLRIHISTHQYCPEYYTGLKTPVKIQQCICKLNKCIYLTYLFSSGQFNYSICVALY